MSERGFILWVRLHTYFLTHFLLSKNHNHLPLAVPIASERNLSRLQPFIQSKLHKSKYFFGEQKHALCMYSGDFSICTHPAERKVEKALSFIHAWW
jgi:hypothetical protein